MNMWERFKNWWWQINGWLQLECGCWEHYSSYTPLPFPCVHQQEKFEKLFGVPMFSKDPKPKKDDDDDYYRYSAPFIG